MRYGPEVRLKKPLSMGLRFRGWGGSVWPPLLVLKEKNIPLFAPANRPPLKGGPKAGEVWSLESSFAALR